MIISQVALWLLVGIQTIVILGLLREVGLLQLRVGPMPAMQTNSQGHAPGVPAPEVAAVDPAGELFTFGRSYDRAQLVVFLSPSCGVCHELVGPVGIVARAERRFLDVIAVCGARAQDCVAFLGAATDECRVAIDPKGEIKSLFNVSGSSFAIVIDRNGRIGESGVVNNLQHLEYLLRSLSRDGELLIDAAEQPEALVQGGV